MPDRFRIECQPNNCWRVWDNEANAALISDESYVVCCNIADDLNGVRYDPGECGEVAEGIRQSLSA